MFFGHVECILQTVTSMHTLACPLGFMLLCPRPDVSTARSVNSPVWLMPTVSMAQCVHGAQCPWPDVFMACWGAVSMTLCVHGLMYPWPNVSMTYWGTLSIAWYIQGRCVHDPVCPCPAEAHVSMTWCVHSLMSPHNTVQETLHAYMYAFPCMCLCLLGSGREGERETN